MRRLLLPLLLSLAAVGCSSEPSGPPPGGTLTTFERIDTVPGTGAEAVSGSKVTVHSVCKIEGSTATTDGVFEGAFDSSYKGSMKTRYNPPLQGMSESNMTQQARWLGPCKPGQKPGDVIMPKMGNMDINKMMKDPKFQKMMREQQEQ